MERPHQISLFLINWIMRRLCSFIATILSIVTLTYLFEKITVSRPKMSSIVKCAQKNSGHLTSCSKKIPCTSNCARQYKKHVCSLARNYKYNQRVWFYNLVMELWRTKSAWPSEVSIFFSNCTS